MSGQVMKERGITGEMFAKHDATEMNYSQYLKLDDVLGAQQPMSMPQHHDEMLFIIIHQAAELWLKLIGHELQEAMSLLRQDKIGRVGKVLSRVKNIQNVLFQQWPILSTLTPDEFSGFRKALGESSGFQSRGYRALEFMLGNKSRAMIAYHKNDPAAIMQLQDLLHQPSIYDEFLHHLSRKGLHIPSAVLNRDKSVPWEAHPDVVAALKVVYRHRDLYMDTYDLAEKLVDIEENMSHWRYRHLTTVMRVIGGAKGTGGSSGVDFLRKMVDHRFFPELLEVRATFFEDDEEPMTCPFAGQRKEQRATYDAPATSVPILPPQSGVCPMGHHSVGTGHSMSASPVGVQGGKPMTVGGPVGGGHAWFD